MTRAQEKRLRFLTPRTRDYVGLLASANDTDDVVKLGRIQARSRALLYEMENDEMALASRLLANLDREAAEARSATPGR